MPIHGGIGIKGDAFGAMVFTVMSRNHSGRANLVCALDAVFSFRPSHVRTARNYSFDLLEAMSAMERQLT